MLVDIQSATAAVIMEEEENMTDLSRSDALSTRPSVAVSRAVQQLLERHGLGNVSRLSNGNVTVGAFVQVNNNNNNNCLSLQSVGSADVAAGTGLSVESESDFDSDSEPRFRPDPIGGSSDGDSNSHEAGCHHPATGEVDLNGNSSNQQLQQAGADAEAEELSKLRCQSVRTEVLAEKFRRKNRCADYPGFGFASSVFSSDTMMKFNIIKNELHNIMNNQLKRVSRLYSKAV